MAWHWGGMVLGGMALWWHGIGTAWEWGGNALEQHGIGVAWGGIALDYHG